MNESKKNFIKRQIAAPWMIGLLLALMLACHKEASILRHTNQVMIINPPPAQESQQHPIQTQQHPIQAQQHSIQAQQHSIQTQLGEGSSDQKQQGIHLLPSQALPINWTPGFTERFSPQQILSFLLAPAVNAHDTACDQAMTMAIQKDLQAISLQKHQSYQAQSFSGFNQAPSIRGRINVFGNQAQTDQNHKQGKISLRLPLPVDIWLRKQQWEARTEVIKSLEKQREAELRSLIISLNQLIQLQFKLILIQELKLKLLKAQIQAIEALLLEGLVASIEQEALVLDLGLEEDALEETVMEYERLTADWFFYTGIDHIVGNCHSQAKPKGLKQQVFLWEAESLRWEQQAKESFGLFVETGVQDHSMSQIGFISFGLQLPWTDPQHSNYHKLMQAQRDALEAKAEEEQALMQDELKQKRLIQRRITLQSFIEKQKPQKLIEENHEYFRKQKLIKYLQKYIELQIEQVTQY